MKKLILVVIGSFLLSAQSFAQAPFNTLSFVDINNIKASLLVHGDMWWSPADGQAQCFFPASGTKSISFAGSLWMSGYDAAGALHVAAQTYRQTGCNYWPGPLTSDTVTYATASDWNMIWKVTRAQINSFLDSPTHTVANTPTAILQWPGKGNTHAAGYASTPLTITDDMAPFVDLNGDGVYEPLEGEYPDIIGDEGLWVAFSDNGPRHNDTIGLPLDVEVHLLAYGYSRGTLIDNVIYYQYTIINRSPNTYTNFRIAEYADMDLGYYDDDFIGFDSVHRMGITYNGEPNDPTYGTSIPMAGVTMIVLPGDTGTTFLPAASFTYCNNDSSAIGNPFDSTQYNNYMHAMIDSGEHITDDFVGAGTPTHGYGSGPNVNYVYPGDPSNNAQWSECSSGNTPGDRRFIIAGNSFTLYPGASVQVVMALVAIDPGPANACGDPGVSFDSIGIVADTAWSDYFNPPAVLTTAVSSVVADGNINIYPNPAHDVLYIETTGNIPGEESITIYYVIGQVMNVAIDKSGQKDIVDINPLPPGLYNVLYRKGSTQKTAKFVKE